MLLLLLMMDGLVSVVSLGVVKLFLIITLSEFINIGLIALLVDDGGGMSLLLLYSFSRINIVSGESLELIYSGAMPVAVLL